MLSQLLKTQTAVRSTREATEENRKKAEDALRHRELHAKQVVLKNLFVMPVTNRIAIV